MRRTATRPPHTPATAPEASTADLVRAATASTGGGRRFGLGGFSLSEGGSASRFIAPFLGLYLGWAVARVPEVFPVVAVPKLPMVLLIVFLGLLAFSIPPDGWRIIWEKSLPIKCVAGLFILAIVTAPLGIWMSGSFQFIQDRYVVAVVIFLSCAVFLRDRRSLRAAMVVYVICVVAIAIYTLKTYDPNAVFYDDAGNIMDPSEVSIERRRIEVGISLDSNDWGAVLATTIPISIWLSYGSLIRRVLWGAQTLILIAALVPTSSRGSLVGVISAVITLIAVGATGWRRFLLIGVTGLGGLVFSMAATGGELTRFFDFGGDDYNLTNEGRWYFWRQGFVWMLKRPWGYGIDNFPTYFGWLNGPDRAAHSSWVQYGMELGVAGLTLFVLLTTTLWRRNSAARKKALALKQSIGIQARNEATLHGHTMAMLAATLATGSFLSNAYYPLMYMALGIGAAVLLGSPIRDVPEPARMGQNLPAAATSKPRRSR